MVTCEVCGKECKSEFGLRTHMRSHESSANLTVKTEPQKGDQLDIVKGKLWNMIKDGNARAAVNSVLRGLEPIEQELSTLLVHPAIVKDGGTKAAVLSVLTQIKK